MLELTPEQKLEIGLKRAKERKLEWIEMKEMVLADPDVIKKDNPFLDRYIGMLDKLIGV